MVHPKELFRTNSENGPQEFCAPIRATRFNTLDCGITALPCLDKRLNLERFAKPGVFVIILSIVGILHGVILNYFRGTSQIWGKRFKISPDTVDWLIYTNDVFIGIFALVVSYWGNRIHRTTWIGSLTMLLSIFCGLLAVPELYNPFVDKDKNISMLTAPALCKSTVQSKLFDILDLNHTAFALLVVYQIFYAIANISFISHGMSYLDDNISAIHSPGFIGLALAAIELGKQGGIYLSWVPFITNVVNTFLSPVWITLAVLTFLSGILIVLFPKSLPNMMVQKAAASLIDLASGNSVDEGEEHFDGFFSSLLRLLKNKILLFNIFAMVLLQSALINYNIFEKIFNETKYHIPKVDMSGYSDPSLIQFTTNLLKRPLVCISTVTTGLVIAKLQPKAKNVLMWNIVILIIVTLFFASTKFWNCAGDITNEHSTKILSPYCSANCDCSRDDPFQPICLKGKTYFSPCIAGCTTVGEIDGKFKVYSNCRCDKSANATDGSCDSTSCNLLLAVAQVNNIISSGLLATIFVSQMIINIRCVSAQDKALCLGFVVTFTGLIPYLPVRIIYASVLDKFCQYYGKTKCIFYGVSLTQFLSISTIVLMVLSIIFLIVVWFLVENLDLYCNKNKSTSNLELDSMSFDHTDDEIDAALNDLAENNALLQQQRMRKEHLSDNVLNISVRPSTDDLPKQCVSSGTLVPPLPAQLQKDDLKKSGNSGLSSKSFLELEDVGDDHDSESETVNTTQSSNSQIMPNSVKTLSETDL